MKKLSAVVSLLLIVSGCCIFGGAKIRQQCNFDQKICARNVQVLQNAIEKFKADGGAYIVFDVAENKKVEETYLNFDENTTVWAYNPLRLFYLTAGLNSKVFSKKDIVFNTNASSDFKKVSDHDKKRVFDLLGVDDFNTPQQILAGYLNVFTNKEKLLNQTQLKALKSAVADNVRTGAAKKANIAGAEVSGLSATSEHKLEDGRVITVFVGTFKAQAKEFAILTILDNPKGLKETYGFNSAGWNVVPAAGSIIENLK